MFNIKRSLKCEKCIRKKSDIFVYYRMFIMSQHFLFRIYLDFGKWYNLEFFSKRCAMKSSIKTVWLNSFWSVLIVVHILKMNNLHECYFPLYWKCLEDFFVLHISRLEEMVVWGSNPPRNKQPVWMNEYIFKNTKAESLYRQERQREKRDHEHKRERR
jgi:hypothetical protein